MAAHIGSAFMRLALTPPSSLALQSLRDSVTARATTPPGLTDSFSCDLGKQGCLISPLLFCLFQLSGLPMVREYIL